MILALMTVLRMALGCEDHFLPQFERKMLKGAAPGAAVLPSRSVLFPEERLAFRRFIQNSQNHQIDRGDYSFAIETGGFYIRVPVFHRTVLRGDGSFGISNHAWEGLKQDLPEVVLIGLRRFVQRSETLLIQPPVTKETDEIAIYSANRIYVQAWTEDRHFEPAVKGHSHTSGLSILNCELGCSTLITPNGSKFPGRLVPAPPWIVLWDAWHKVPQKTGEPRLVLSASIEPYLW